MALFGSSNFKCIRRSKADTFLCQLLLSRNIVNKSILSPRSSVARDLFSVRSLHNSRDSWRSLEAFDCKFKVRNKIILSLNSSSTCRRAYSSVQTQRSAGLFSDASVNPYILVEDQLKNFYEDIRQLLRQSTSQIELQTIGTYYFGGEGKALRPMITMLMSKAINCHLKKESRQILSMQREVEIYTEMIHAAGLVHDDVIDEADSRRGKPSINALWNHKKVILAGDYIFSVAFAVSARLKNDDVTILLSQISKDIVEAEIMQLRNGKNKNEWFAYYLRKTYLKTASHLGYTFKAVAVLAGADDHISKIAFEYGRHIGMAFQLIDDMLDFVASAEAMGKPNTVDLKQGMATAPVLFACETFPELNPMIARRFKEPGDFERTSDLVYKSNGLEQTKLLAKKHRDEAVLLAQKLTDSPYQKGLEVVADYILNRVK